MTVNLHITELAVLGRIAATSVVLGLLVTSATTAAGNTWAGIAAPAAAAPVPAPRPVAAHVTAPADQYAPADLDQQLSKGPEPVSPVTQSGAAQNIYPMEPVTIQPGSTPYGGGVRYGTAPIIGLPAGPGPVPQGAFSGAYLGVARYQPGYATGNGPGQPYAGQPYAGQYGAYPYNNNNGMPFGGGFPNGGGFPVPGFTPFGFW